MAVDLLLERYPYRRLLLPRFRQARRGSARFRAGESSLGFTRRFPRGDGAHLTPSL